MRCHSLQALWGSLPPQHEVTSILALQNPLSIWAGAADGAISLWKISPSQPSKPRVDEWEKEIWPVAILCGHTAAIAQLEVCVPSHGFDYEDEETAGARYVDPDPTRDVAPDAYDCVVSVCVEGFMCVWDGRTGHCRRRRKLPPWVGKPAAVASFPNARRFLCICSNGPGARSTYGLPVLDVPYQGRKVDSPRTQFERTGTRSSCKGIVVVVDTSTLSVLQVVYNGSLGIGVMKTITIVPESESDMILVADVNGKLRAWPGVVIDGRREGVWESAHEERSAEHFSVPEPSTDSVWGERAESVSISSDGFFVLIVYRSRWILRLIEDDSILAEKACVRGDNEFLGDQAPCPWLGGFFLPYSKCELDREPVIFNRLLIWNSDGGAVIYSTESSDQTYKVVCELAPLPAAFRRQMVTHYCCVGDLIIRSESMKPGVEGCPVVETRMTVWRLQAESSTMSTGQSDFASGGLDECHMYSHAGLWADWLSASSTRDVCQAWSRSGLDDEQELAEAVVDDQEGEDLELLANSFPKSLEKEKIRDGHQFLNSNLFVSATMLLSGSSFVPSMIVYGFSSGEIRMVELEAIEPVGSLDSPCSDHVFKQRSCYFAGHNGPILCLAEHNMAHFGRVLLSGGVDSCVCVWDLQEDGAPLAVFHHHVAPVRQLVLPPPGTLVPWSHCFISVGDDACVAIVSLETLQVVRMFPGHPVVPKTIAWDHQRGYVAVLCPHSEYGQNSDSVYIWDIHSGARERILRGASAHSMFSHFTGRIRASTSNVFSGNAVSASSLLPLTDEQAQPDKTDSTPLDAAYMDFYGADNTQAADAGDQDSHLGGLRSGLGKLSIKVAQTPKPDIPVASLVPNFPLVSMKPHLLFHKHQPIKGACPLPGVAALQFNLFSLMASAMDRLSALRKMSSTDQGGMQEVHTTEPMSTGEQSGPILNRNNTFFLGADSGPKNQSLASHWLLSVEGRILRMSLSFLHLWGVDTDLDHLLVTDLQVYQPAHIGIGSGLEGDRGAMTLFFPSQHASLEPWRSSAQFAAMRSLTMVSLAQRLILLSKPASYTCSELAGFYSRGLAEKLPGSISPCLEVYACFWQDPSEHVRMAARTLFHCAALRAIPPTLMVESMKHEEESDDAESEQGKDLLRWLESSGGQYWTLMIGGTQQDAKAARIIVAASFAAWYPTYVRPDLARVVAPLLLQMVRAANDRHVVSVAEILSEGMTSTWYPTIAVQARQLMVDIFERIEWLSNVGERAPNGLLLDPPPIAPAIAMAIRESLVGNLLPSLAMAELSGFLHVVQDQLEATTSDSPVHRVALTVLIRSIRGAPKAVLSHLSQVTMLILQTMDTGNFVLRKQCMQSAMAAVREMVRVFPMVALYPGSAMSNPKLAVGDPVGDVHSLAIHVYDLHSMTTLKVLDASGPPGHPALLWSEGSLSASGISALTFSKDGEGLVAFSQNGLIIRWWSLGANWWERLSRSHVPVQCTKLLLVPPWSGFSPRSSSSSIMHMATLGNHPKSEGESVKTHQRKLSDSSATRLAYQNLDLSYRLEWQTDKIVALLHHGQDLGTFQL